MRTPITSLAQMYRQRIPTTTTGLRTSAFSSPTSRLNTGLRIGGAPVVATAPTTKLGPRRTSIEDVRRVASRGSTALPSYERQEPERTLVDSRAIMASIAGGPGPGYGEKYGLFPTASAQEDAIMGEAYGAYEMGELARLKAAELGASAEEEYAYNMRPVGRGLAGQRIIDANKILRSPLSELATKMSAPGTMPSATDFYGANMARMNALRGTGDYLSPEGAEPTGREQLIANSQMSVQPEALNRFDRAMITSGADQYQQIADVVEETPLSQYAQMIATNRYGMDPAQAAGMFTRDVDIEFEKDTENARRLDEGMPQITMDQFIWDNFGPEEYNNYMMKKAEQLVYGSPEEIAQAEQDSIDLANDLTIAETFGFRPTEISGVEPETIRLAMSNPDFQTYMDDAMGVYNDPGQMETYGNSATTLGNELARNWLNQGGTMQEAKVLQRVFATFDFSG